MVITVLDQKNEKMHIKKLNSYMLIIQNFMISFVSQFLKALEIKLLRCQIVNVKNLDRKILNELNVVFQKHFLEDIINQKQLKK